MPSGQYRWVSRGFALSLPSAWRGSTYICEVVTVQCQTPLSVDATIAHRRLRCSPLVFLKSGAQHDPDAMFHKFKWVDIRYTCTYAATQERTTPAARTDIHYLEPAHFCHRGEILVPATSTSPTRPCSSFLFVGCSILAGNTHITR